jgi:hypothetical protein
VSVGWPKLCHRTVLLLSDRMMKFPVLSSMASADMVLEGEELTIKLLFDLHTTLPLPSDKTRSELLFRASIADERSVISMARLATHTTVSSGMLLYHMPI